MALQYLSFVDSEDTHSSLKSNQSVHASNTSVATLSSGNIVDMQGSISQDQVPNSITENSDLSSLTSSENVVTTGDPHSEPTSLGSSVNVSCEDAKEVVNVVI